MCKISIERKEGNEIKEKQGGIMFRRSARVIEIRMSSVRQICVYLL